MNRAEVKFICPNCGLVADDETSGGIVFTMVSTIFDEDDPWSGVLQRSTCPECDTEIPNHLAYRWDGMTQGEAKREWKETYKDCKEG